LDTPATAATPLWPLAVYFAGVLVLVGGMMGLSYILGEHHKDPQTGQPFESGIRPTGSARVRLNIKYYLVAMFFVVFDLEGVFLFAWAVAARELGWPGYIEALVFIGVLVLTLAYLWKLGALDWGTDRRRIRRNRLARAEQNAPPPTVSPLPGQTEPPAQKLS
jgi:NADH-quinone oxidoreductase subunit A